MVSVDSPGDIFMDTATLAVTAMDDDETFSAVTSADDLAQYELVKRLLAAGALGENDSFTLTGGKISNIYNSTNPQTAAEITLVPSDVAGSFSLTGSTGATLKLGFTASCASDIVVSSRADLSDGNVDGTITTEYGAAVTVAADKDVTASGSESRVVYPAAAASGKVTLASGATCSVLGVTVKNVKDVSENVTLQQTGATELTVSGTDYEILRGTQSTTITRLVLNGDTVRPVHSSFQNIEISLGTSRVAAITATWDMTIDLSGSQTAAAELTTVTPSGENIVVTVKYPDNATGTESPILSANNSAGEGFRYQTAFTGFTVTSGDGTQTYTYTSAASSEMTISVVENAE